MRIGRAGAAAVASLAAAAFVGCTPAVHDHSVLTDVAAGAATQPADPAYWLNQPPALAVTDHDLDRLWNNAERVSERYLFAIDRRDRRAGLMTTSPSISPQWFEPWRQELQTADDVVHSSVATVRRTIYWSFGRQGDGYQVTPKVLIEREALTEQRVSGLLGRGYFQRRVTDKVYGTRETDRNVQLPDNYWYPTGRDFAFEQKLADDLAARLGRVAGR